MVTVKHWQTASSVNFHAAKYIVLIYWYEESLGSLWCNRIMDYAILNQLCNAQAFLTQLYQFNLGH